jgi:ATP-dependent Clp protease adaptor protein ClpS
VSLFFHAWHRICLFAGKEVFLSWNKKRNDMAEMNNPGSGTGVKSRERILIEEPHQYKVIFHNDDFTTMEFVTDVLRRVFNKPADEAVTLMMKVHREGQAVVGVYSYDVAMTKASQATTMARQEGFPLNITCEPD